MSDAEQVLAVAVGNTRVRWGLFEGEELRFAASFRHDELEGLGALLREHASAAGLAVVGSVRDEAANAVEAAIHSALGCETARVNRDLAVPLSHTIDQPETLGVDRALCALAAFRKAEQACVVIDAGTAITVDFIDGKGVFHGGAILPGGAMMLRALRAGTAQLPELHWPPAAEPAHPMGHNTAEAMLVGTLAAARGAVRHLIEQYSEFYGAYPQVIATGGDAALLFDDDGLVEHIIPDLQLMGLRLCLEHARGQSEP